MPQRGDPPFDCDRRRAEDVYRALESDVFPRLGAIDTKIVSLEQGVQKLIINGCSQRPGDVRRTEVVEDQMTRIFEKIDSFGEVLADARVEMVRQVGEIATDLTEQVGTMKEGVTKQVGGIRIWVLTGVVVVLLGLLIYFVKDYAHDIESYVGKAPAAVTQPR